jgi:hypothetical protein
LAKTDCCQEEARTNRFRRGPARNARRKDCGVKLFLVGMLATLAPMCASAQDTATPARIPHGETVRGPRFFQLNGGCESEVSPDVAVIAGGVAVAGLKPTETTAELDKQLELIRGVIEENHGRLTLQERARTIKSPSPNGNDREPPFEVVQRLQAEFPAEAPVDSILEKMIALGLDRFGDNVLRANASRREAVIRYRNAKFDAKIAALEESCTQDAWKKSCATDAAKDLCYSKEPPGDLQLVNFHVRSEESVLQPEGNVRRWQFTYSNTQHEADSPELLGNIPLHLTGTILLNYRVEPKP